MCAIIIAKHAITLDSCVITSVEKELEAALWCNWFNQFCITVAWCVCECEGESGCKRYCCLIGYKYKTMSMMTCS